MPDPVQYISRGNAASVIVGGVTVWGAQEVEREGGQHAPKHKMERGYEYTTRVGSQAVTVIISGWVNDYEMAALARLEDSRSPIPVMGPNVSLPACSITSFRDTMPGSRPGAHRVEIHLEEVKLASTGQAQIRAVGPRTGTKTAEAGGEGAGGSGRRATVVQTDKKANQSQESEQSQQEEDWWFLW